MSLHNEVILVTGSSRGLGLAIVKALREEGAKVVLCCRTQDGIERVKAMANQSDVYIKQTDVRDAMQVRELFEAAKKAHHKPISVVVNNALDYRFNGDQRKKLEDIDWTDFNSQMQTVIQGALNTTKAAIPGFGELGYGRIINVGTNLVQNPVVPYHDYTAAKGALLAFTHTMAAELGPKNITCNLVSGGLLRTTDASAATPEAVFDQIAAITPLRKVTTPEDLAGAVVFFAGPHAKAVTGQQIVVDGGLCMT